MKVGTTGLAILATLLVGATACSGASSTESTDGEDEARFAYVSDQEDIESTDGVEFSNGTVPDGEGERIAVVLKTLNNQYWQGIERGVLAAAEDLGVEVTLQAASSETAHTEQLTIAQTLVNQQFDAYVVAPETTSNLNPALTQMRNQGAPIVNVDDARIPGTVYVGPNHELNGQGAADYFAELHPEGGSVAQIEGQAGSSAAILRIAGFTEGVDSHDNLELVASVPGNWDANEAFGATQQILRQHPDLIGIYANNDTMAIGVARAVREAGLADQVAVVGTDGVPEAVDAVRTGTMAATFSPLPFYEGYWAVEAAVRLLHGQDVSPWVVAPSQLIDSDSVDEFYDEDGQVRAGIFD